MIHLKPLSRILLGIKELFRYIRRDRRVKRLGLFNDRAIVPVTLLRLALHAKVPKSAADLRFFKKIDLHHVVSAGGRRPKLSCVPGRSQLLGAWRMNHSLLSNVLARLPKERDLSLRRRSASLWYLVECPRLATAFTISSASRQHSPLSVAVLCPPFLHKAEERSQACWI